MAELARAIRDRIRTALTIETETGPLTTLLKAFQTALVHDLDEAGFADMYAQTIAYGLLSARITDPARRTADDLAAHMRTNPFPEGADGDLPPRGRAPRQGRREETIPARSTLPSPGRRRGESPTRSCWRRNPRLNSDPGWGPSSRTASGRRATTAGEDIAPSGPGPIDRADEHRGSHAVGGQVLHGIDQMGKIAAQAVELSSRRRCLA